MKNIKRLTLFVSILIMFFATLACKKDKQECLTCNAVCQPNSTSTEMKNCGDDNDAMEKKFRDQNQGCVINCTREKK